ncbi:MULTISPECIES: LysR family transcriptional regulator [unclassified Geodermatophilus]
MDVHLRDLRYFLAVADELHFTRAAQRLFVSQPALSRQIQVLEQHVRAPLFARGPRGVTLTAAGRALVPYARSTVATWDEAQSAVAEAVAADSRTIRVGMSVGVGRGLIPAAVEVFQQRHPGFSVEFQQTSFDDRTAGLTSGATDLAFCWLPLPEDSGLRHRVLISEQRHLALPVNHPLTARAELTMADLYDEPFLALPESNGSLRDYWLAVDARHGHPVRIGAVVHGPEEAVEALGRGLGVALISAGNAEIYRRPEYVVRPVRGLPPGELAIAWRSGDPRPAVHDFVLACVEAARQVHPSAAPSAGESGTPTAAAG